MIIYDGPGDVFNCDAQTIACPINTAGAMGAGLAYAFKRKVPGLYEFYRREYPFADMDKNKYKKVVYRLPNGLQVLLMPTKRHWEEKTNLADLEWNINSLAGAIHELNITSLALPPLGCGLGGLDYQTQVKPLIYKFLGDLPIPVQVLHR